MPHKSPAWAVAVHGGAGNSSANADGCVAAAQLAAAALHDGAAAIDAAVAAVVRLEDDGRFNAGSGAIVGLDGQTFELDAAVMDSRGTLGAVACVSSVRNPVRLAHAVSATPHCLLVGSGAERFARRIGMPEHRHDPRCAAAAHRALVQALGASDPVLPGTPNRTFEQLWNYAMPWSEAMARYGSGTVGAVVRDAQGRYAVATSTGGAAPALLGRVGDTPLPGCGYHCGAAGAVACTGLGEAIIRRLLARTVYGWIEAGTPLVQALADGVALFPPEVDIGLIGVSGGAVATASNRDMPVARLEARA